MVRLFFCIHQDRRRIYGVLEDIFLRMQENKIHAVSNEMPNFAKTVRWCGRIIDAEGFQLDPRSSDSTQNMKFPIAANELSRFLYCSRCMSSFIPSIHQRMKPQGNLLEETYKMAGKRKSPA